MKKLFYVTGFTWAIFGLFGCNQSESLATGPIVGGPMGSAMIKLPALPKDYLAKTGAGTQALFVLSISGEGMQPIRKSWTLYPGHVDSVVITGIPSGFFRNFTGQLFQMDSMNLDSTLTHEGIDNAYIESNKTADINLFLHEKGAGSAHVCITIEKWTTDTTCINAHPTLPFPIQVAGCWKISVTKKGSEPKFDSVFTGKLSIHQWDSALSGTVTWNSGEQDSSTGYIVSNGSHRVVFGSTQSNWQFSFNAILDSTGSVLSGVFVSPIRNITGNFVAALTTCDTLIVPTPQPSDTIKNCYIVSQTLKMGKGGTGRLALVSYRSQWYGDQISSAIFRWNGYPDMQVYGQITGSLWDSCFINLRGIAPPGMIGRNDTILDSLEYHATLVNDSSTFSGRVLRMTSALPIANGTWKGTPSACTEKDMIH